MSADDQVATGRGRRSPERARRRRRSLLGLAAVALILGLGATPPVDAQQDRPNIDQFGGFEARARSNALSLTYDQTGLVPVGPVFQLSVPEALATMSSGPTGYALSSLAYPGPLIADLGAALSAGGTDTPIPPYPVRSEAFYPSGPGETVNGGGGTQMSSRTEFADSRAESSFVGIGVSPMVDVGSVTAASRTTIEGDSVVSRTRTEVGDVTILGGLVHIESVVTDLVARSTGASSASDGVTTVGGATVLGLPVTIDSDGIHFAPAEDPDGDGSITVIPGISIPDPGVGDALSEPLEQLLGPLNDLLDQVGAAGEDALMQLFEASGIEIRVAPVDEVISGASALRQANGLEIAIHYDGNNTPVITDLLSLIPNDLLPSDDLGPIPLSPAGLFNMLKQTHLISFAVAPASVRAVASPAFEVEIPPFEPPASSPPAVPPPAPTPLTPSFSDNFDTALPDVASPPGVSTVPVSSPSSPVLGLAIPALLIFAVILGTPFFAAGSSRLADAALLGAAAGCPDGLDQPPASPGAS